MGHNNAEFAPIALRWWMDALGAQMWRPKPDDTFDLYRQNGDIVGNVTQKQIQAVAETMDAVAHSRHPRAKRFRISVVNR